MTSEFPKAFETHVASELTAVDMEAAYDAMLDEIYDFSKVGGPFSHMSPARVLSENEPVAYRCGKNDFEDSESDQYYEIDGEFYEVREVDDLFEDWKADQPACKHCGDALVKNDAGVWIDVDSYGRKNADVCASRDDDGTEHESEDDDSDPEACKGCGCVPGDGVTEGCNDPDGCGYLRDFERVTGTTSALKKDE